MSDADISRFDEMTQAWVCNAKKLLRAPKGMQQAIREGQISAAGSIELLKRYDQSPDAVNEYLAKCERDGYGQEHLTAFNKELKSAIFGEVAKKDADAVLGETSAPKGKTPPKPMRDESNATTEEKATPTAGAVDAIRTVLEALANESPNGPLNDIGKSLLEVLDHGKSVVGMANAWIGCHVAMQLEVGKDFPAWQDLQDEELAGLPADSVPTTAVA
jgi:hypothetical protein